MSISAEIQARFIAHEVASQDSTMKPTIYIGDSQFAGLLREIGTLAPMTKNMVGADQFMGMDLVRVRSADYLRVA